ARAVSRSKTKARSAKAANATPALNALMDAGHSAAAHSPRHRKVAGCGLEAPITGEIERQLQVLMRRFGHRKVRDALTPLLDKCRIDDWLCVANAVDRLARKAGTTGTRRKSRAAKT